MSLYEGTTPTDSTINITAYHDWMDSAEDISSGKELRIEYDVEAARYYIVGAECE